MPKPYENKEYIDWIEVLVDDTVDEGGNLVTLPEKMHIRDVALLLSGIFDSATVTVQYSPDEMETKADALVPADMEWFELPESTFTVVGLTTTNFWENLDAAEGWFRIKVSGSTVNTDIKVKTRPRVEATISF